MARLRSLKKSSFEDRETAKLQTNMEIWTQQITNVPIIDGVLLRDIELTTGSVNKIEHKLGRKLIGWMIAGQNANAVVWDSQSNNTTPNSTVDLNCSANVTINLWVF